jgi:hypothetical protein
MRMAYGTKLWQAGTGKKPRRICSGVLGRTKSRLFVDLLELYVRHFVLYGANDGKLSVI